MADKKEKSKRTVNPNLRPWKKGQSGNPKGRPTREMQCRELLAQIGEHGDEALAIIAEVMRNPRACDAEEIRLKAANSILDRIVGKPTQSVAASILQRNIPADGTLIEGSTMMSPLLAAAQAHFVEREMKQIEAPQAAPDPSPPLPDVIVLPDQSVASSKPTPQEPVAPLPSVQKAEASMANGPYLEHRTQYASRGERGPSLDADPQPLSRAEPCAQHCRTLDNGAAARGAVARELVRFRLGLLVGFAAYRRPRRRFSGAPVHDPA